MKQEHLISTCPHANPDDILQAFDSWAEDRYPHIESTDVFYEHGQWFARIEFTEDADEDQADFSVVDTEPGFDGLDFEQL